MIKFENTEVFGWEHAIRGMRNPMNSWEKSDTDYEKAWDTAYAVPPAIGPNDLDLMMRLRNAGSPDHRKFMRMITVYVDITAPLYWWKEFDTYKVGTVANSCSTMHKIAEKEFTMEDFSTEYLLGSAVQYNGYIPTSVLKCTIGALNEFRKLYLESKNKVYWWQMIQLLPSSYNQKRTVMMNYEVLVNIYKSRKNHKLDEWAEHVMNPVEKLENGVLVSRGNAVPYGYIGFCDWIKTLPYSELITDESK